MSNEKRIPSKVVSALLRLERAGDEHSKTSQRLCDAAWLVADLLRQRVPDGVEIDTRTELAVSRQGVAVFEPCEDDPLVRSWWRETIAFGGDPTPPSRAAALVLAEAVADGWLDEVAAALATRVTANREATAVLDAAAEQLQPDECPKLRQLGVYLLPDGLSWLADEVIACEMTVQGKPIGWALYDSNEWAHQDLPGILVNEDGFIIVDSELTDASLADLTDTGRTARDERPVATVSPTPGSLVHHGEAPRPPVLRERGVYLLPCGGEAIACQRFQAGKPAGWLLYTPAQWQAEAPSEYQSDIDGSVVSRWGYDCPWTLAELVDTGRTVHPETDRLAGD